MDQTCDLSDQISLEEVVEAYYTCRKNKRNTASAIRFEMNLAANLVELWQDINRGTYQPGRSIAFVVTNPVCREVFAAQFRDRIVHHLIINKLEEQMESYFIDDSYSCRPGKGTFYGQKRVQEMIRECSDNYTCDCWVMKIDIQSFFMSINKQLLFECLERFVKSHYHGKDIQMLLWLIRVTVFHRPELDCERHSPDSFWDRLPKAKSLFGTDGSHGLPIGNHTSQMFAMLFLTELDRRVKEEWKGVYYGRYVDDMVLVARSVTALKHLRRKIARWLDSKKMRLSPKKVYIQYYDKGVTFVGACIKPGRMYVQNRVICHFFNRLSYFNEKARCLFVFPMLHREEFQASMNSYFGLLASFDEYRYSHRLARLMRGEWYRLFEQVYGGGKIKCKLRYRYQEREIQFQHIKNGIRYRKSFALAA